MKSIIPVKDLTFCSVKGCHGRSSVIIQKKYGEEKMMFGYCEFHAIISATFFEHKERWEIRI